MFGAFGAFPAIISEHYGRKYAEAFAQKTMAEASATRARMAHLQREQNALSPYAGKYITVSKTSIPEVKRNG